MVFDGLRTNGADASGSARQPDLVGNTRRCALSRQLAILFLRNDRFSSNKAAFALYPSDS
jgi:hypothetical protein